MDYLDGIRVRIEGELYTANKVCDGGYLPRVEMTDGTEWYIATREQAEAAVRSHWRDMAENDRKEFVCIIGEERLVGWALGENDSFGISSLEEFLEVAGNHPEEELAGYDGEERDVTRIAKLRDYVDVEASDDLVAYRCN